MWDLWATEEENALQSYAHDVLMEKYREGDALCVCGPGESHYREPREVRYPELRIGVMHVRQLGDVHVKKSSVQ